MSRIPNFFKPVLWSYDLSKLDSAKDYRTILVQTINYGDWRHWQWLVKKYGKERIAHRIETLPASEFRSSALKLAQLLFGVKKIKYVSRSAYLKKQKNLAKA